MNATEYSRIAGKTAEEVIKERRLASFQKLQGSSASSSEVPVREPIAEFTKEDGTTVKIYNPCGFDAVDSKASDYIKKKWNDTKDYVNKKKEKLENWTDEQKKKYKEKKAKRAAEKAAKKAAKKSRSGSSSSSSSSSSGASSSSSLSSDEPPKNSKAGAVIPPSVLNVTHPELIKQLKKDGVVFKNGHYWCSDCDVMHSK
jgi:hypothetical protein